MNSTLQLRPVAAFVTLALALAACSSDSGSSASRSSGSTASGTTTTVQLTGPPIKLMTIFDASGDFGSPEIPEGARAAVDAVNRAGGVGGRPLELIECNAQSDPNKAAACGKRAVDEGVVAVVGSLSVNAGEYLPALEQAKIPAIGSVPASAADFINPVVFPLAGGLPSIAAGLAKALAAKGATTVSVARVDAGAASAIKIFAEGVLTSSGAKTSNDVAVPTGAPDMATYVASALQGGTDGVLIALTGQDATNFIVQLRQAAPSVKIAAATTDFTAVVSALGSNADGILSVISFDRDESSPEVQQYKSDLAADSIDETDFQRQNPYVSVMVTATLLKRLTDVSAPALLDLLPTVSGLDAPMLPTLQFTTGGVGGIPRVFNPCVQLAELGNGKRSVFSSGFVNPFTGASC